MFSHSFGASYIITRKTHDLQTRMTLLTETWAEECEIGLHATDTRDMNGSQWEKKKPYRALDQIPV